MFLPENISSYCVNPYHHRCKVKTSLHGDEAYVNAYNHHLARRTCTDASISAGAIGTSSVLSSDERRVRATRKQRAIRFLPPGVDGIEITFAVIGASITLATLGWPRVGKI
jgi:hypothetical protein